MKKWMVEKSKLWRQINYYHSLFEVKVFYNMHNLVLCTEYFYNIR